MVPQEEEPSEKSSKKKKTKTRRDSDDDDSGSDTEEDDDDDDDDEGEHKDDAADAQQADGSGSKFTLIDTEAVEDTKDDVPLDAAAQTNPFLAGAIPAAIFTSAIQVIPNPTLDFCIEFLSVIEEFKNVELPVSTVLDALRSKFSSDPKCIEFLAKRRLEKDRDSAGALQEYERAIEVREPLIVSTTRLLTQTHSHANARTPFDDDGDSEMAGPASGRHMPSFACI